MNLLINYLTPEQQCLNNIEPTNVGSSEKLSKVIAKPKILSI